MFDEFKGLPEFVVNISNNLLIKTDKFGSVLFVNNKAKCVFNEIDVYKSLKFSVQADDWIVLNKNIEIALYNQHPHNFYWEYKGRFYTVNIYPKDDYLWLCFEDITEKRHLSHLLHINLLRNSFGEKLSKSGYWELDMTNRRFYWSDGVYKLFEIDNKNGNSCRKNLIRDLILPQDMILYKTELRKLLKYKKDIHGFIRILTSKKQIKKCRFGAGIFYENGEEKVAGVFVDVSDCTEQNCERCAYLSDNFNCLSAKIVHDLRQPISAIGLLVEDIERNKTYSDVSVMKLKNICNNLNSMIESMLNSANSNRIVGEKFNLKDVIEKVCMEFDDKFKSKNIRLILKLDKYDVFQNLFLVEKMIRNLLDNALKFAKTKVLIKNINGCFWVIDDGVGIDKKYQKQIFNDFFQCNKLSCGNPQGFGLGLGIVKYCASLTRAKLEIKSRSNAYAIFKVCL